MPCCRRLLLINLTFLFGNTSCDQSLRYAIKFNLYFAHFILVIDSFCNNKQINVTPIKKYHFILGKLIPFWIIGMFVFSLGLFGVARLVYGIVPVGSLVLLYAFLAIYLGALLGIGLIISTYSSTQQQAMSLAFFCIMIFLLMSGLFTSIDSMPE
jgi:ABC-type multidrug transport system permease subunit